MKLCHVQAAPSVHFIEHAPAHVPIVFSMMPRAPLQALGAKVLALMLTAEAETCSSIALDTS